MQALIIIPKVSVTDSWLRICYVLYIYIKYAPAIFLCTFTVLNAIMKMKHEISANFNAPFYPLRRHSNWIFKFTVTTKKNAQAQCTRLIHCEAQGQEKWIETRRERGWKLMASHYFIINCQQMDFSIHETYANMTHCILLSEKLISLMLVFFFVFLAASLLLTALFFLQIFSWLTWL